MKTNKFIKLLQEEKLKRMGKVVTKEADDNDVSQRDTDVPLTLQELREKYPDIKARSKDEFLNKISRL